MAGGVDIKTGSKPSLGSRFRRGAEAAGAAAAIGGGVLGVPAAFELGAALYAGSKVAEGGKAEGTTVVVDGKKVKVEGGGTVKVKGEKVVYDANKNKMTIT